MLGTSWMVVIDLTSQGVTIDRLMDNDTIQLIGQWQSSDVTVYNYHTEEGWPEYKAYIVRSNLDQYNNPTINQYIESIFKKIKVTGNVELNVVSHDGLVSCCEFNNKKSTPKLIDSIEWLEKVYE